MRKAVSNRSTILGIGFLNADRYIPSITRESSGNRVGPLIPLGDLVIARKESIDPSSLPAGRVDYIGLENIESNTGRIIGDTRVDPRLIKSRSKVFYKGDILFSKLRPNLNKIAYVSDIETGICSGEIYALTPKSSTAGLALSFLLRLPIVRSESERLVAGAALPRLDLDKILGLKVPSVTSENMGKLHRVLLPITMKYNAIRAISHTLYCDMEGDVLDWIASGGNPDHIFDQTENRILGLAKIIGA